MSGRPPKPTKLKILAGNPGRRDLNDAEPTGGDSLPPVPSDLTGEAAAKWAEMIPILHKCGILGRIDGDSFAMYCRLWARWTEAEQKIVERGQFVGRAINPAIRIANEALKLLNKLATDFGMTPAARTRIRVEHKNNDNLASWLKRKGG